MSSAEDVPRRAKNPRQIKEMIGFKRKRPNESSDDENFEEKKIGTSEILALLETGDELQYLPLPINRAAFDSAGNRVEFEELIYEDERTGYIRCTSRSCPARKEAKFLFGHFKAHVMDNRNNTVREYKKSILDRHVTRWHTGSLNPSIKKASSSSLQPKLGVKLGFQTQLSTKFKDEYKKKTMNLLAKKGLPLNFCEDDSFKDWFKK